VKVIGSSHNGKRPFTTRTVDGWNFQRGTDVILTVTHPTEERPLSENTHNRHVVYMRYAHAHRELGANHPTTKFYRDAYAKWKNRFS
jgi:hypothetical protein